MSAWATGQAAHLSFANPIGQQFTEVCYVIASCEAWRKEDGVGLQLHFTASNAERVGQCSSRRLWSSRAWPRCADGPNAASERARLAERTLLHILGYCSARE